MNYAVADGVGNNWISELLTPAWDVKLRAKYSRSLFVPGLNNLEKIPRFHILHMLSDFTKAEHVYLACGYSDLRRGIDGLAAVVQQSFCLDPFSNSLFLFCGRRCDRLKALYWEGDGFVLL